MTKILVIEDEDLVARLYKKALTFDGFDVSVASGGEQGIQMVKDVKPDLVLLDIMMPEPNGIQVLEKIKSDPDTNPIPIAMLTNLSGKHDAELALTKGAVAVIVKSQIKTADLGKKIRSLLNEKQKTNSN